LQRHPGFHHYQVLNLGVAGTCVTKGTRSGARSFWPLKHYELAMKSHPHIVVVQFGSNDVIEGIWDEAQFVADYSEMIKKFQELPSRPSVYVGVPPPYNDPGKEEGFKRAVNAVLPGVIRGMVASLEGVRLIDNFEALGGRELTRPQAYTRDNLHPNDVGYTAIAHQVASVLSMYEGFSPISHKVSGSVGGWVGTVVQRN
jgi:lysophospholipase L1-like esterase